MLAGEREVWCQNVAWGSPRMTHIEHQGRHGVGTGASTGSARVSTGSARGQHRVSTGTGPSSPPGAVPHGFLLDSTPCRSNPRLRMAVRLAASGRKKVLPTCKRSTGKVTKVTKVTKGHGNQGPTLLTCKRLRNTGEKVSWPVLIRWASSSTGSLAVS